MGFRESMIRKREEEGETKTESVHQSTSAITPARRFVTLDAHRGFIMALMAVDHASYFIARVHSVEFWGAGLPVYPNAFWFWTRWITHLCAPGFFFLMGIGMISFADVRHKAGWNEGRITRFFVIRGLLLMFLQLFVENPAWILGDLSAGPGVMLIRGGGVPGGGAQGVIYFGVLFALGGAMVFWAFLRRSSPWIIGLISLGAILVTQVVTPSVGHRSTLYSPFVRLLMIPGHTDVCEVFYPVVPWLGVTGLGLIFGILLKREASRAEKVAAWTGFGILVLFAIIRATGKFGNLNEVPAGWMGFLNVVKYPPSLGFLTITMGINLIFMALWGRVEPYFRNRYHPLLVFGRVALFFYLLHLWVYNLLGLFFRSGSGLVMMYAVWLLGLVILYPLCYWYNRFKNRNPITSLWRFL
jgi:uncharacterized membrane protein